MDWALLFQLGIPVGLVAVMLLSVDVGFRVGRRRVRRAETHEALDTGSTQGALLGLLGLLLAFSFGGASSRYVERQDLIMREANVIGTAYLRADLLDPPHAEELQAALVHYVDHRLEISRSLRLVLPRHLLDEVREQHVEIWRIALAGVQEKPGMTFAVLGPINEVFDLHASRVAAGQRRLPGLILVLLVACSMLTLGVLGYASALAHRRNGAMNAAVAVLISAAMWTTFDLDSPRIGLIRISDVALERLDFNEPGP